jgi:hypothetical protein
MEASHKHSKSKSKPVGAAQSGDRLAGWVSLLLASGSWFLASWPLASASCLTARPPNFLGLRRNRDGRWECTVYRNTTRRPAPSLQAGELGRSSS